MFPATCITCLVVGSFRQGLAIEYQSAIKNESLVKSIVKSSSLLISTLAGIFWLFLSAVPMRSVSNVYAYVPKIVVDMHELTQPFALTSSYGLFRQMTGVGNIQEYVDPLHPPHAQVARPELILEGFSAKEERWIEIAFRYKPGDVMRSPPWIAPYQPRLDWQMWFASLGSYQGNPWLISLVNRLLIGGNNDVLNLIDKGAYPFIDDPPTAIRAVLYDYDFTRYNTSGSNGAWWVRFNRREYLPAIENNNPSVHSFLAANRIMSRPYRNWNQQFDSCILLQSKINHDILSLKLNVRRIICSSILLRIMLP